MTDGACFNTSSQRRSSEPSNARKARMRDGRDDASPSLPRPTAGLSINHETCTLITHPPCSPHGNVAVNQLSMPDDEQINTDGKTFFLPFFGHVFFTFLNVFLFSKRFLFKNQAYDIRRKLPRAHNAPRQNIAEHLLVYWQPKHVHFTVACKWNFPRRRISVTINSSVCCSSVLFSLPTSHFSFSA